MFALLVFAAVSAKAQYNETIRTGRPACDLDTAELVRTLREHGAYLPQKETTK